MPIGVIIDSSASLPEIALMPSIRVVKHHLNFEGYSILDSTSQLSSNYTTPSDLSSRPKTGHPNPLQFLEAISDLFANGYHEQIILTVSSKISGTYNSAVLARDLAIEKFRLSSNSILVVDSDQLAMGHGLIALEIANVVDTVRDSGNFLTLIDAIKRNINSYFLVSDISFLYAGGRIHFEKPPLMILPQWHLLEIKDAQLSVLGVSRTYSPLIEKLTSIFLNGVQSNQINRVALNQFGAENIAAIVKSRMLSVIGSKALIEGPFSTALSVHLGPKAVGVFGLNSRQQFD